MDWSLYYAAIAADNEWHDELVKVFKKRACDARYTEEGVSTPRLKELYDIFRQKTDVWMTEMRKSRE